MRRCVELLVTVKQFSMYSLHNFIWQLAPDFLCKHALSLWLGDWGIEVNVVALVVECGVTYAISWIVSDIVIWPKFSSNGICSIGVYYMHPTFPCHCRKPACWQAITIKSLIICFLSTFYLNRESMWHHSHKILEPWLLNSAFVDGSTLNTITQT